MASREGRARLGRRARRRYGIEETLARRRLVLTWVIQRRRTLLVEIQRRHKVGGIVDHRFGENDPTMALEEKMRERFAWEKQKSHKKRSIFDLEDDDPSEGLTHKGRPLDLNGPPLVDDFDEGDLEEKESEGSDDDGRPSKRMRLAEQNGDAVEGDDESDEQVERRKTKREVMEEVIAKSKFHKYERQQAKEADDNLRRDLDKQMPNIMAELFKSTKSTPQVASQPVSEVPAIREQDARVKQLALERRAQPSDRTKTAEEIAEEQAAKLRELEEKRVKRMRGEDDGSEDSSSDEPAGNHTVVQTQDEDAFGLGQGIKARPTAAELGDDEDDFIIDDDLVASGSDYEPAESEFESESDNDAEHAAEDDDDVLDDPFVKQFLSKGESLDPIFRGKQTSAENGDIPYTFPCPKSLSEFVAITKTVPPEKITTVVQRIRALYHPKLSGDNRAKMALFSQMLVEYIGIAPAKSETIPFGTLEGLIRQIHSLAKSWPLEIARKFRDHLSDLGQNRPLSPHLGDLVVLTAIGTVFPTSDHFHPVATPAMLCIARYLGQKIPRTPAEFATGVYLSALALQYQRLSKRYVPEVMNFSLNTLCALAPSKLKTRPGWFPVHDVPQSIRVRDASDVALRKLKPQDCRDASIGDGELASLKLAILGTTVQVLDSAAELWSDKAAFYETFMPVVQVLDRLVATPNRTHLPSSVTETLVSKTTAKLKRLLSVSRLARRPLELHHHRPLPIRTFVPRFEEDGFNPDKHYDVDRERAELAKLRREHKRERKGALRELRRDAQFLARESLRARKARDEAYEKRYRRLVAEIQGEEGREKNEYSREKERRKRERRKAAAAK